MFGTFKALPTKLHFKHNNVQVEVFSDCLIYLIDYTVCSFPSSIIRAARLHNSVSISITFGFILRYYIAKVRNVYFIYQ